MILETIPIESKSQSFSKNPRLELVDGDTISETYRNTYYTTVQSCMTGSRSTFYERIENLQMIRIVSDSGSVVKNKELIVHLRVLIWDAIRLSDGKKVKFVDRVYCNVGDAAEIFKKHWKKYGKIRRTGNENSWDAKEVYSVNILKKYKPNHIIYSDTFKYINNKDLKIYSNNRYPYYGVNVRI